MTSPNGDASDVAAALLLKVTALDERLGQVDTREAGHYQHIAATVADQAATLAALDGLDQRLADLAQQFAEADDDDRRGYRPGPQPKWWHLAAAPGGAREA